MPGLTSIYSFIHVWNEQLFWDYEYINWITVENQVKGLYLFTGSGVVNGWDVESVTESEAAGLPDDIKSQLSHTSYCMMFKVTAGDGIIGVYAAYTPETTYFSLPIIEESKIYYVYAIATDCLPGQHRAEIYYTTDSTYDSTHRATYLATIITYYDPDFGETYIYRIYDENYRRTTLKNLQGPALEAIREKLNRHKHIGQPDTEFQIAVDNNPSKISLGNEDIESLTVVASSPIFLLQNSFLLPKDINNASSTLTINQNLPYYEKVDIKVNGTILNSNDYYLDNINGKLYLLNSVKNGDVVQVVKYTDPSHGQIARGPQDDPNSYITVTGDDRFIVDERYKLPKNRVGDIDASKIVFGTLPISRIKPISHYGMQRIRESAILNPRTLTRSKDQYTYYLVPSEDKILGYDTEILFSYNSKVIGNVISIASGLYKVNDVDYQDLTKYDFPDDVGRIIDICDNNVEGDHNGEAKFTETYVLTDEGQIWFTQDTGATWEQLEIPEYTGIFVNCFTVSTDKVEKIIKNKKTWDYYKVFHLGTNMGVYTARYLAAKGTITGSTEPVIWSVIPWYHDFNQNVLEIISLQEVITGHSYVTEDDSSYWYDRTLYIGTEDGFYIGNKLVTNAGNIIVKDIMWVFDNTALLVLSTDNKVYITHTFEHIQTDDGTVAEDYWKHPLSEIDEELHISYSFIWKTVNKLSQESGRRKYLIGLDRDIAISTLDSALTSYNNVPFPHGIVHVYGKYGINLLNAKLITHGGLCGLSALSSKIKVLSLDNVADQSTRTDAEKEIAEGWSPLDWNIPTNYCELPGNAMENTQTVLFSDNTNVEYSALYGSQQQPTDYYAASYNGIWKSSDGGNSWRRPVLIWDTDVIPYVERNGDEVSSLLGEYRLDHTLQAIQFSSQQDTSDAILVEKNFQEYFAVNGSWEQDDADLAVYINGEFSSYPYTYNKTLGKFIFTDKLTKTTDVTFSLMDLGTYITDIGTTPHSEILDAFIKSTTISTELANAVLTTDTTIKVLDTTSFPIGPIYIQIEDEKIYVKKKDIYTFEILKQRNNSVAHIEGKTVYLLEVKRQYGIDDYISLSTSGQTYNIFSLYTSNLLREHMATKHIYENMFDNIPRYPLPSLDAEVYDGVRQELVHIGGIDVLDEASAISTLWNGLDIPSRTDVATPRMISSMLDPGTSSFIVGTDRGVWKFDGNKWDQLTKCDNASIVHYVYYDNIKGQSQQTFLLAGADNGLWTTSDSGETWVQSATLYEEQLSYMQGTLSWWDPSRKYAIYGKNNGLTMIVYGWDDGYPSSFHSDHFDPVDNKKVYGFYQGIFYRIDEDTGQKKTFDSIWVMSEDGLYLCYNGLRYYKDGTVNPYSSILKGVEPVDPGYRTETTIDSETGEEVVTVISGTEGDYANDQRYIKTGANSDGEDIYEKLKFFGAFQDSRPKTVPLIFLTNDGLRIARNWRWIDPEDVAIYLSWEATPLSKSNASILTSEDNEKRITCNCYTTGIDDTIDDDSPDVWKKYKSFVGTSKGVYRSYDGCYNMEPCQNIPNTSTIYALDYNDGILYAGTDNGWWFSLNDGDDWNVSSLDVSNVEYIDNSVLLAQTFIPEYNEITKVGLYLHPKQTGE